MSGLLMHAVVFVAVNGLLTAAWILLGPGTADEAWQSFTDLDDAQQYGFWPIYVMIAWAAALLVHAGATVSLGLRRIRRRRRARTADRRRSSAATPVETAVPVAERQNPAGIDRRWFAVMFTDVVSSTELARDLGDDGYAAAMRAHRAAVRSCLEAHGGNEVGTQGDGFLLRFDSPDAAVACAVALQDRLAIGADGALPLRIGVHAGEVVHDGDDDDLLGRVVNLASRVTDVAGAGEILITEAVADHLTLGLPLTDRGLRELKGFDRPRHLLSVVWRPEVDHLDLDTADGRGVAHPDGR